MHKIANTSVANEKENFSFLIQELTRTNKTKYTQVCTSNIKILVSNVVINDDVSIE